MGLIATIAALVLGLLIATANSSFKTQDAAVKHMAARTARWTFMSEKATTPKPKETASP